MRVLIASTIGAILCSILFSGTDSEFLNLFWSTSIIPVAVAYQCRYQVCSFVVKTPRSHGNCKFRNEWLAIDKFKDWVARDRTGDKVAKCTLCMKTVRFADAGKRPGKPCDIGSTPKM